MPPASLSTNWSHIGEPHRNCRHSRGYVVPRKSGQQAQTFWLPLVFGKHLVQVGTPRINLWPRLRRTVIAELRRTRPHHLAHRVPRYPQLTADLLDRLHLDKLRPPDLLNRFHNQHPQFAPSIL